MEIASTLLEKKRLIVNKQIESKEYKHLFYNNPRMTSCLSNNNLYINMHKLTKRRFFWRKYSFILPPWDDLSSLSHAGLKIAGPRPVFWNVNQKAAA